MKKKTYKAIKELTSGFLKCENDIYAETNKAYLQIENSCKSYFSVESSKNNFIKQMNCYNTIQGNYLVDAFTK